MCFIILDVRWEKCTPRNIYIWPDMPKPATCAYNGKVQFFLSLPKSLQVCLSWRLLWSPTVFKCLLNGTNLQFWLVQADPPCWISSLNCLIIHALDSAILCDNLGAIGPHFKLHFLENCFSLLLLMIPHHLPPSIPT